MLFAEKAQIQSPVIFTDCCNLAKAVGAAGANDPAVLWEIRRHQCQNIKRDCQASIFHISREINGVAHSLTHQARRFFGSEPICSCRNVAHSNIPCPMVAAAQSMQLPDFVILDVQCY
jgi:hypothetical protein